MRKSKPDLLIVLAILIGFGIVATEVVRAFSGERTPVVKTASR